MDNETKKINNEAYFQVPKSLFKMRRNGEISLTAFDIYILMLDRYKLSEKNNWIDEENRTYIIYSYEELLEDLCIRKREAISKALQELETLEIIKKNRRFNKSTVFYLNIENFNSSQKGTDKEAISSQKGTTSSNQKGTSNSSLKVNSNNNNINKNNKSNNNIYNNNSNNIYTTGTFRNELRLLLGVRKIDIDRILKYCNDIEKIKDVIDYANKNNKGDGYIIAALKENYNLTGKKQPETHREKRAELDSNIKSADPCNAGEKDYSMSIDEALKRSRGKK